MPRLQIKTVWTNSWRHSPARQGFAAGDAEQGDTPSASRGRSSCDVSPELCLSSSATGVQSTGRHGIKTCRQSVRTVMRPSNTTPRTVADSVTFRALSKLCIVFTARSSYASTVFGMVILSVRLSVRPSITRVLCDETKEHTAKILIPHKMVINLVFRYQNRLVGDVPFHLKFPLKLTHSLWKKADFDIYMLITS